MHGFPFVQLSIGPTPFWVVSGVEAVSRRGRGGVVGAFQEETVPSVGDAGEDKIGGAIVAGQPPAGEVDVDPGMEARYVMVPDN